MQQNTQHGSRPWFRQSDMQKFSYITREGRIEKDISKMILGIPGRYEITYDFMYGSGSRQIKSVFTLFIGILSDFNHICFFLFNFMELIKLSSLFRR